MRHLCKIRIQLISGGVFAFVLAGAGACANAPLHTDTSTSGIRAAEEVGAADVPRAALHLQLAKEELERAKGLSKKDEPEQAESMLRRAEADAELAVALSRENSAKQEAEDAVARVRSLRQENKTSFENSMLSNEMDIQ